jgi:SAM-dependent methyltransferase
MSIQKQLSDACVVDLERYGDNFRGVGYTKSADDAARCYAVMLGVIRPQPQLVTLVDLGCGLAHLLDHLNAHGPRNVRYTGIDLSEAYLAACRTRHPEATFLHADVLADPQSLPESDYIVMNGLFNYRGDIPRERMQAYVESLVKVAWSRCRKGIAFNVMSKQVDWERDDLYPLSFDELASFVRGNLSRHFAMRQDYGMYEYTAYVHRDPLPLP